MAAARKIPPNLHEAILAKAGEGLDTERIAAWLVEVHGITVTSSCIRRVLIKLRKEREPIARAVIAAETARTVGADLKAMDWLARKARRLGNKAERAKDIRTALYAVRIEQLVRSERIHLAGGAPADPRHAQERRSALLEKLAGLVREHRSPSSSDLAKTPVH